VPKKLPAEVRTAAVEVTRRRTFYSGMSHDNLPSSHCRRKIVGIGGQRKLREEFSHGDASK
jgi:hypothetical protein